MFLCKNLATFVCGNPSIIKNEYIFDWNRYKKIRMKISGFTFIKNGDKLYIPTKESILSILPICDEFVIALGDCDADDRTEEIIASIQSPKIKIVRTVWDTKKFPKNTEFAHQTDIAKAHCTGDWLFYLQCDEAIHEKDLPIIKEACERELENKKVEGFLFKYLHFWGDYKHYHRSHAWYNKEIRIIRNLPEIHSWRDAQSFKKYNDWKGASWQEYQKTTGVSKLKVKELDVYVYHYGYVRPPILMTKKRKVSATSYHGEQAKEAETVPELYDYGPLNKLTVFNGSHPATMQNWIKKFDWKDQLQYSGKRNKNRPIIKHEKPKYRLLSWIENTFLGGTPIGGFNNYTKIK